MREFKRKKSERQPLRLIRGADGRLRSAHSNDDIGDIWAEQRRIKLQEAIEADKRRTAKAAARKARWKQLLSRRKRSAKGAAPAKRAVTTKIPLIGRLMPKTRKKPYLITAIVLGLAAIGYAGFIFLENSPRPGTAKKQETSEEEILLNQRPTYDTVLPIGKTIDQLGGWARVSPQNKQPVFAYVDEIDGVRIRVSQQPLPSSFKKDIAGKLAELAEQFNAQQKLTAGETTIYVGTSIKGPQSAVLSKQSLLILISADSKLTNKQWTDYIWLLH